MSQKVRINDYGMGYFTGYNLLLINGVYWGYNPLIHPPFIGGLQSQYTPFRSVGERLTHWSIRSLPSPEASQFRNRASHGSIAGFTNSWHSGHSRSVGSSSIALKPRRGDVVRGQDHTHTHIYGNLTWGNTWGCYMPKKTMGKQVECSVEKSTISDSCQVVEPCWTIQFNKLYMLSSQIWETHHLSNIWGVKMNNIDQKHQAPRFETPTHTTIIRLNYNFTHKKYPPLPKEKC